MYYYLNFYQGKIFYIELHNFKINCEQNINAYILQNPHVLHVT